MVDVRGLYYHGCGECPLAGNETTGMVPLGRALSAGYAPCPFCVNAGIEPPARHGTDAFCWFNEDSAYYHTDAGCSEIADSEPLIDLVSWAEKLLKQPCPECHG